jgi:hypothetical protein
MQYPARQRSAHLATPSAREHPNSGIALFLVIDLFLLSYKATDKLSNASLLASGRSGRTRRACRRLAQGNTADAVQNSEVCNDRRRTRPTYLRARGAYRRLYTTDAFRQNVPVGASKSLPEFWTMSLSQSECFSLRNRSQYCGICRRGIPGRLLLSARYGPRSTASILRRREESRTSRVPFHQRCGIISRTAELLNARCSQVPAISDDR